MVYAPPPLQPVAPPVIHVEPSKHMSVGGFLVAVLLIIVLFVVFAMFFARSWAGSATGGICGLVVAAPIPLVALLEWTRRARARLQSDRREHADLR